MAFDRDEFRRKARAKAIRERVQKVRSRRMQEGKVPADDDMEDEENLDLENGEGKLSKEEENVLRQYRQWKRTRESAQRSTGKSKSTKKNNKSKSAQIRERIARRMREEEDIPVDEEYSEKDPSTANKPGADTQKVGKGRTVSQKQLESRRVRVQKLRRKLEKRRRIAKIKDRIAERRESANDNVSSTKIREDAKKLKRRISRVRKMIEQDMQQQPMDQQSQMMDPADPNQQDMGMDMEMEGMDQGTQLPPEVVTEIQNISTAAQSLAALAGVQADDAMGADPEAGVGAEMGAGVEGMEQEMDPQQQQMDPQQQQMESRKMSSAKKKKVLEGIKKRKANNRNSADSLVESTRSRVASRREALKKLRAQALSEDAYQGAGQDFTANIEDESQNFLGNNHNDPKKVVHQQGRSIDGPSKSMPGSKKLKPAKTWPTKPAKGGKFESKEQDNDRIEDEELTDEEREQMEKQEEKANGWDEKHINHYIERKELDFGSMIKNGLLG